MMEYFTQEIFIPQMFNFLFRSKKTNIAYLSVNGIDIDEYLEI